MLLLAVGTGYEGGWGFAFTVAGMWSGCVEEEADAGAALEFVELFAEPGKVI